MEIKNVRINTKTTGYSLLHGVKTIFPNCTEIINKYLKEGYEYKGFVPVEQGFRGTITKIDLIFVKK